MSCIALSIFRGFCRPNWRGTGDVPRIWNAPERRVSIASPDAGFWQCLFPSEKKSALPIDIAAGKPIYGLSTLLNSFVAAPERRSTDLPLNLDLHGSAHPARRKRFERKIVMSNTGTVKWFNATKGFGFIQPDNGQPDVFVHISAVEQAGLRTISEGQKIGFDVVRDARSGKSAAANLQAI